MDKFNFLIDNEDIDSRIDIFLSKQIDKTSRTSIQKLITDKKVLVNNKPIKHNYKLKKNDEIICQIEAPTDLEVEAQNIKLEVLFEDKDIIVINKPKGMVVHPAPGHNKGTLVNALLHHCKGELSGINGIMRPGIVHRIDKDTTGVLVVAKSNEAHICLSKQLENHTMNRVYNAIVFNNIKEDFGTINEPIGRHPIDRKKMAILKKNGKESITNYKVLERFGKFTFIEAVLETGRTHQIRVHMAFRGNPLLGDTKYSKINNINYGFDGQALHAKVLGFIHPTTKIYMEFETSLPIEFENALKKMRKLL
jgi:23S rRNA pseudouridine1911/1915/1917 synthase